MTILFTVFRRFGRRARRFGDGWQQTRRGRTFGTGGGRGLCLAGTIGLFLLFGSGLCFRFGLQAGFLGSLGSGLFGGFRGAAAAAAA